MRIIRPLALASLMVFIFSTPVFAALTLGISPMRSELELKPGDTITRTISASNPGNTELEVSTEITDYKTDANGTPVFSNPDTGLLSGGRWLQVNPPNFELKPGQTKEISLKIKIPKDATPGGHYGAVLFKFGGSQSGVGVSGRIASITLITVPGKVIRSGSLTSLKVPFFNSGYPVPINLAVTNGGNVHLSVEGNANISDLFGNQVASIPIPQGYVLPGSSKNIILNFTSGRIFGIYKVLVSFNEHAIGDEKASYFVVFPWQLVLGILLAAYGLYRLGMYRGRRKE